ncbi:hypothetical protein [Sphingomonas sp. TREG-RG-20F-R18-01]|uniref:hypothetical protein n=1 Tax=Sphingomonas sp. TREG-RG-20F-R18-01 TaxID=2914982 RepID=UPI001F58FCFF|nr:hypothetical protein [Sphingomonas sp. TREG-RG-20F-R18-01]
MSAGPIGNLAAALTRGARASRTYQPVRRDSRHAGEREQRLWRQHNMFSRDENNTRMTAAEKYDDETKLPGKRNGALGSTALKVLRVLLRLRGRADGRLEPSYAWLADKACIARSTVGEALARLKEAGFLDWVRRTQRVEDPERPNQYVEQIPNAFILTLPGHAEKLIRRIKRKATDTMRNVARQQARDDRAAGMTSEETVNEVKDHTLRDVLNRLRIGVESANPPTGQK